MLLREHRREGLTGETWKIPVGDFTNRALYTHSSLHKLSNVLNSGEFITNDPYYSADQNEKVVKEQVQVQVRKFGNRWRKNPNACAR